MSGPFIIDGPVLHFIRTTLDTILFEERGGVGGGSNLRSKQGISRFLGNGRGYRNGK